MQNYNMKMLPLQRDSEFQEDNCSEERGPKCYIFIVKQILVQAVFKSKGLVEYMFYIFTMQQYILLDYLCVYME